VADDDLLDLARSVSNAVTNSRTRPSSVIESPLFG